MIKKRYSFILIILGMYLSILNFSPIFSENSATNWRVNSNIIKPLGLNPQNTQYFFNNNILNVVSIVDGQIVIYELINSEWNELQRLSVSNVIFTSILVKDITGDLQPEIVAGTAEPGFIYIYGLEQDHWAAKNYDKYVWSSISHIATGNFSPGSTTDFVIQNIEGSLIFLKKNLNTLDIVWKSPTPSRIIQSSTIVDFDNDSFEEILVTYKAGGVAILKIKKNAVTTVWQNYPWGKILATAYGDWNNDGHPEFVITTSQKMLYILSHTVKGYQLTQIPNQFDYLIENLYFLKGNTNELITTDASGKTHILEYDSVKKKWVEILTLTTGRIVKLFVNPNLSEFFLWGYNQETTQFIKHI